MFEKLKEKLKRHTKVIACAGALAAAVILGTAAGGCLLRQLRPRQ